MAGSKLTYRAKASTLLEVIIAMVMIVLVFGIAMMIFNNVMRLSPSAKKTRAGAVLQETLLKIEHYGSNKEQVLSPDDFKIVQEVKPYNADTSLTIIHLSAYDQKGQLITELQKVIINKP